MERPALAATALAMAMSVVLVAPLVLKGLERELVVVNLDVVQGGGERLFAGRGRVIVELDGAARVGVVAGRAEDDARDDRRDGEGARGRARQPRRGGCGRRARARAPAPARSDG